jgi:hypothetical protein
MKTESILFLLTIHEGNELRDDLPGSAYDELVIAGLLDGTEITEKGYAFVRHLSDVPVPVQVWADPRSLAAPVNEQYRKSFDQAYLHKQVGEQVSFTPEQMERMQKSVDTPVLKVPRVPREVDEVPPGYSPNPGHLPGGVDRAADIQIVRANGKRKALPAQAINWSDVTTLDRVIGWRYAPAGGEARIHTPGETVPAPDV